MSDWIIIEGVIEKTAVQVKPGANGWLVIEKNTTQPRKVFAKKKQAVLEASRLARERHAYLDVYSRSGKLETHAAIATNLSSN